MNVLKRAMGYMKKIQREGLEMKHILSKMKKKISHMLQGIKSKRCGTEKKFVTSRNYKRVQTRGKRRLSKIIKQH